MADVKISGLPASTVPLDGTEVLPVVQGTTTKQVSITNVTAGRAIAALSITTDTYKAASSAGGTLQANNATACLQWGAGGGSGLIFDGGVSSTAANAALVFSPTGTGTVAISPVGALTINPTAASTINNVSIGVTTPLAGKFTTLEYSSTLTGGTGIVNLGSGQFYKDASGNISVGATASTTNAIFEVASANKTQAGGTGQAMVYSNSSMAADLGGQLVFGAAFTGTTTTTMAGISGRKENGTAGNIAGYCSIWTNQSGVGAVERQKISSTGIVTMSAYGAGAATFSASGVISSVSDETWKIKDGVPVNPDEMLQKLEPGYWFYSKEKAPIFGEDRQLGFYAQNVNKAIGNEAAPIPEADKPWGYYDRSVLAVTVMSLKNALNTIQELNAKFDAYVTSHP